MTERTSAALAHPHPDSPGETDMRLASVRKSYGDVVAVDGIDLEIRRGEFFTMLGPSGSGKTTCLRMIAGFERPDSGRVELAGEDVTGIPPAERDVNTVFQDYALFPHMTVGQQRRVRPQGEEASPRPSAEQRVAEALAHRAARWLRRTPPGAALRRSAPARRACARARQPPARAAARRAARRARPEASPAAPGRAEADPVGGRHHIHLRDPRPGRGADDERSHCRRWTRAGCCRLAPRDEVYDEPGSRFRRRLRRCLQPARATGRVASRTVSPSSASETATRSMRRPSGQTRPGTHGRSSRSGPSGSRSPMTARARRPARTATRRNRAREPLRRAHDALRRRAGRWRRADGGAPERAPRASRTPRRCGGSPVILVWGQRIHTCDQHQQTRDRPDEDSYARALVALLLAASCCDRCLRQRRQRRDSSQHVQRARTSTQKGEGQLNIVNLGGLYGPVVREGGSRRRRAARSTPFRGHLGRDVHEVPLGRRRSVRPRVALGRRVACALIKSGSVAALDTSKLTNFNDLAHSSSRPRSTPRTASTTACRSCGARTS